MLALNTSPSWAQTRVWDGGAGTGNWGTAGNWDPDGTTFGNTVDLAFYKAGTPTGTLQTFLGSVGRTMRSLTFNVDADSDVTIKMDDNATTGKQFIFDSDTGTATITVASGSAGNYTIETTTSGGRIELQDPIVINHGGSGTLTIKGMRDHASGVQRFSGTSVTKSGSGTLVYTRGSAPASYYYIGETLVTGGIFRYGANNVLDVGAVTVNGGTIDLATFSQTTPAVGTVTLLNGVIDGTGTLTSSNTFVMQSGTVNVILAGSDSTVGLNKNTAGTVTLIGANTYSGTTVVNGGTLWIDGSQTGATGGVTIGGASASGTPALGGTGTIGGNVTIKAAGGGAAGTLAPGGISAGTLALNSKTLTLESGAKLSYRLGTASDSVAGVSTLNLNGQVWNDFTFTAGSGFGPGAYILIAATSVSGSLGASVSGSIGSYTGTLSVNSNSDLVLTLEEGGVRYDQWALNYGLGVGSEWLDSDGDGANNLYEYSQTSNPTNASDRGALAARYTNGVMQLIFRRNAEAKDLTYIVEAASVLTNPPVWTEINTNYLGMGWSDPTRAQETGTGPTRTVTVEDVGKGGSQRFMRLEVAQVDAIAPTVTINQAAGQGDPTNVSPINFTVVFSEAVSGFQTGDVTVSGTAPGTKTATVTGSGTTYNVAVSGMTGSGTVIASLNAGVARDLAGNLSLASTSTDNTVTYDLIAPTVTINQAAGQGDPTNASPINFTVVFSEAVSGFQTGDVTVSGTAPGTKTATVTGSGTTYNVAVSGMAGNGTVIASLDAGVAHDLAGNLSAMSTSTDNTVSYDITAPTVTINQAAGQADPTSASPINFTVVFSEVVMGFATGDVTLSGTAGATTAAVTGGGTTYNVAVSGMTGSGTVIASLAAGVAQDAAGNLSAASTSIDRIVTYQQPAASPTFYVSNVGNDAWDGHAPEYLGGTSGPWQTLAKVNQSMDALGATNVLFRRGDRFEGRLEVRGTNITFGAYGAGTNLPTLTGARTLTNNWSAVSGRPNLYQNPLPADVTEVTVVLRGDTSLPLGRTPNGDLSTNTGFYTFSSRTLYSITDPELTGASGLVGSEIVLRKNNWSYDGHPVTNISGTIVSFNPTDTNDYQLSAAGYFFQKHTNTLDSEGEWFFDESTRKLYVYSATNPNQDMFYYSAEPVVVQITNASGITLQGLGIDMGVSFGINATNSTNVQVLDCAIGRIGRDGVRTYLTTALIRGNNIYDCLGNGIYADGQGKPVVITSNLISSIGLIPGRGWNSGEGVAGTRRRNGIIMFSGGSEASYNRLNDIGYVGIHHLYGNNLLRRNVIDRYNLVAFDGGAIYTYQSQSGTVIEENMILNGMANDAGKVPGSSATSTGIQGDAKTSNMVIRNNTITYSQSSGGALQEGAAGIHFNYDSKNNTVISNTIVVSRNGISTLDRLTSDMSGNKFDNNVIVRTTAALPADDGWAVFNLRDRDGCDVAMQGLFRSNVCAVPFTGSQVIYEEQGSCDAGGAAFETYFSTAAAWDAARSYASGNLDAPLYVDEATAPPDFIQIYINDSDAPRIFTLPAGTYVDPWGNGRVGSITVAPWRSTVLFKVP